ELPDALRMRSHTSPRAVSSGVELLFPPVFPPEQPLSPATASPRIRVRELTARIGAPKESSLMETGRPYSGRPVKTAETDQFVSEMTSPPLELPIACQEAKSMLSRTKRTEPSPMTTFTPPEW